jgi:hypothetical protein
MSTSAVKIVKKIIIYYDKKSKTRKSNPGVLIEQNISKISFQIIAADAVSSGKRFEAKQEKLYRALHSTGFQFSIRVPAGCYSK